MADNYVSLRIKATDDAKPDLDDLKAKLDELSHKVATARAQVDDKEADAALAALDVKLRRIAGKVVDPKIKVAGAERALADILAVDVAMDRLKAKTDRMRAEGDAEAASGGLLGRLLMGRGGGLGGLLGGDAAQAGEGAGGASPQVMGGVIGALIASAPALIAEADALASGFAAAGAGAGAFALLAMPAFKKVSGAVQQIHADQQAYDRALTKTAKNNALAHLKQDWANLDPAQRDAVRGVQQFTGEFGKISKAFEPEAFKVFSGVLKLANELLPHITPFARIFADSISGLLGQAGKFADSKGFGDWLKQFQALEGPSLNAIGAGVGHLVTSFGKLFTIMSAKDVANGINIAFSIVDGVLIGTIGFIKGTMWVWDRLTTAWDWMEKVARRTGHDIAAAWDFVRHKAAELGHDVAVWFDRIRHDIARWADDAGHDVNRAVAWFKGLPGRIAGALAALPGMLFKAGQNAIQGLLNGAQSMIGGVLSTVGGWAHDIANAIGGVFGIHFSEPSEATQMVKAGRNVALGLAKGMTGSRSAVEQAARTVGAAAGPRAGAHGGGAHGYGAPVIIIRLEGGDDPILRGLRNAIRIRGGNVQTVLGQG